MLSLDPDRLGNLGLAIRHDVERQHYDGCEVVVGHAGQVAYHEAFGFAERANGQPIENLGVTPDIPYAVTAADVQGGYAGYIKAADAAVSGLLR